MPNRCNRQEEKRGIGGGGRRETGRNETILLLGKESGIKRKQLKYLISREARIEEGRRTWEP